MGPLLGLVPRTVPRLYKRKPGKEQSREATTEASSHRQIYVKIRRIGKTGGIPSRKPRDPPTLPPWPASTGARRSNERRDAPHLSRPQTEGCRSSPCQTNH